MIISRRTALAAALSLIAIPALAADYPAPKQGDWIARDFRFHTGEPQPDARAGIAADRAEADDVDSRPLSCQAAPISSSVNTSG